MTTLIDLNDIPIIDLAIQNHLNINSAAAATTTTTTVPFNNLSHQLDSALHTNGIALLTNHGIDLHRLVNISKQFHDFCAFPANTKNRYECHNIHGYIQPNIERFNPAIQEIRHTFNIVHTEQSKLPNDQELSGFRENLLILINQFYQLQCILLKALASSLNVPSEWILNAHKTIDDRNIIASLLRLLHYPRVPLESELENIIRCGAHYDYGTFTILWQDTEGGLEIRKPNQSNHEWHRVGYKPGALLIIVGEILEIWSEKRYPAILHRVNIPEDPGQRMKCRNSIIWFTTPQPDILIGPIQNVCRLIRSDQEKEKFQNTGEFYAQNVLRTYEKPDQVLGENLKHFK